MATNCKGQAKDDEVERNSHNKTKTLVKGERRKTYRRRMRPQDFQEHGFSTNCLGCEWIQNGLYGLIGYRNHTDSCRQRMDEALGIQMRIPMRCDNVTGRKESEDGQTRAKKVPKTSTQDTSPRTICSAQQSTLNCADLTWKIGRSSWTRCSYKILAVNAEVKLE